ncbi:MAG: hypothetical protein GDA53_02305, partial [Rhodobacteraceae bacterium]|nr:hypothetical protein [Paracoccaceae bacterium]
EGGSGNDRLVGGAGDDSLHGGAGNDVIFAGDRDRVDGGGGKDVLSFYGNGGVGVTVDLAEETLNGTGTVANVEYLAGGYGNDTFRGDERANWLAGGRGNDTLTGQGGADEFVFQYAQNGEDVVTDFDAGEGDTLVIGGRAYNELTITREGADTIVSWQPDINGTPQSSVRLDNFKGDLDKSHFSFEVLSLDGLIF